MKTLQTEVADLGYLESGPTDGFPVLMLHGFPDDALAWEGVVAHLENQPLRLLRPYLRGYGPSRVTVKNAESGNYAALGQDALDFADALGLGEFLIVGQDWGGRAAFVAAVIAPERLQRTGIMALGSPYGQPPQEGPEYMRQVQLYWYQWFFQTAQGQKALERDRDELSRALWRAWSPHWQFAPADFTATAASFRNPQFVDTVLHSYRYRWHNAPPIARYAKQEAMAHEEAPIPVPVTFIGGEDDHCTPPSLYRHNQKLFTAGSRWMELPNTGHFVQREQPEAVAREILSHLRWRGILPGS